ncbi:metallophosphoesterase [Plebeiibacterium sediminum]|uniref:Metallophosphoesterase n=1 Tax=Plebeiibacterium sediminum TaxID=2992112 RepID=A0AAE3MAS9_9BACT|nr:metallophosphoesterase [Plebeiobacterium sediminum]MCW3789610.1 metallophosphoesterase [Plebeiobacterium sediminum]
MVIQYCSDLHLEFIQNSLYLHKNPMNSVGDILVLAGDITYWGKKHFKHSFFDYISKRFKAVYYVPGNHEFYTGKDLRIIDKPVFESIRENIWMVNNTSIAIEGVEFFFSTLWSNIPNDKSLYIENNVSDFYKIKYHGKDLNTDIFNELHERSIAFLQQSIVNSKASKKVIVTHHVPSQLCNPEKYKTSIISPAFVTELHPLIHDLDVDYWIYGHHHDNMPEKEINGTNLVTNQLGYVHLGEHHEFKNAAFFEI